jgi:polar amino acid transport system ATP-binding protein
MIQFENVNKWYKKYHALDNVCGEVNVGARCMRTFGVR